MPLRSRRRQSEQDGPAGGRRVDLADFGFGAVEADAEAFDLAEPALALGFCDPVEEAVADLDQPAALGGVGA
ncbi:hypothetical protein [Streptomyces sp. WAC07061]|uniref:hypothetical protein n=1 Tax=Streptomyces sp. WAC07061 TaxID=2487410 RepID=UPI00163C1884|nr:hypothetical protein [Streptomyces sp. WAC07061]